jgi:hypothetical protein
MKIIPIKSCDYLCPNYESVYQGGFSAYCMEKEKFFTQTKSEFPEWCPLEDATSPTASESSDADVRVHGIPVTDAP